MKNVTETMKEIIQKCDISFEGEVFTKEIIIRAFSDFLSETIEKRSHNVGVVVHPNSICFDALALTFSAMTNLISNENTYEDVISSLQCGDYVIYGGKNKERYIFDGIVEGEKEQFLDNNTRYVKLSQGNKNPKWIAEKSWYLIQPYNGTSTSLNGKGIKNKKSKRDDFFIDILGLKKNDVPSVINSSSVIVMQKEEADRLVDGIEIGFSQKKKVKLSELVSISYFTENNENCYAGNSAKNEAIIKICSKISVARQIINKKNGNTHTGVMVFGEDIILRYASEIPELINKRSIKYIYLCSTSTDSFDMNFLDNNPDVEVFVCNKDFLRENNFGVQKPNKITVDMAAKINIAIDKEIKHQIIEIDPFDRNTYTIFKKALLKIKRSDYISDKTEYFVINAYSLMNLFKTSIFPLTIIDEMKEKGLIEVESPEEKINKLSEIINNMPQEIIGDARLVMEILNQLYLKMKNGSEKEKWLREYLYKRINTESSLAIIVPKAYYITIMKSGKIVSQRYLNNVSIMTPGRFDSDKLYDEIIVIGNTDGKKFNIFTCNSSSKIRTLFYEVERKVFNCQEKNAKKIEYLFNKKSTIKISEFENYTEPEIMEKDYDEESELNQYISTAIGGYEINASNTNAGEKRNQVSEIAAVVTFSDDSKAFLTKNYKAYVLNEDKGVVNEVKVSDLCDGDSIIFTQNNNDTKDIVDSVLQRQIREKKLTQTEIDCYTKSKEWKYSLIQYMEEKGYSATQVANQMIDRGLSVPEVNTIRGWMDEDSHTVGPQKVESIEAIGIFTGNEKLANNSQEYFDACNVIRKKRMKILKDVGEAIINSITGNKGTNISKENENISSLAKVLQIEQIIATTREVPNYLCNKPLDL